MMDVEHGKIVEKDGRRARVDDNSLDTTKKYAVFMQTYYLGRWYYDGYRSFDEFEAAVEFRDAWISGIASNVITHNLAWRIRRRGLPLPVDGNYVPHRLKQIAIEQAELLARVDALDEELKQLAEKESEDVAGRS